MSHAKLYPPDKIGPNPDQPRESFERKKQWRPWASCPWSFRPSSYWASIWKPPRHGPRSAVAPRSLAVWMQGMRDRGPLNDRERRRSQRGNTVSLRFIPAGVKLFSAPGAVEVRTR